MVLRAAGAPLVLEERPPPQPGRGEVRIAVEACAVCRTDLHIVDGELALPRLPVVPGHEIVGRIEAVGDSTSGVRIGERVGVPWLGRVCGRCRWCLGGRENLCDVPVFTGHGRDGGYATHVIADASACLPLGFVTDPVQAAPLLCAGLIGWRSLRKCGDPRTLGLYGFGAAAHLVAQVALREGRRVFAFTRPGDARGQEFATELGAAWAGGSDETPPEPLDAAIIFAPVGALVPLALAAVAKGGRVVCGGIHMSAIPSFDYRLIWEERELVSVANLTRADGAEFMRFVEHAPLRVETTRYALARANDALADLRAGRIEGAAVLVP